MKEIDTSMIKPIPKYIEKRIHKLDKHYCPIPTQRVRFYNYFAIWKKHLVQVTVAVKDYKKQWYCKQVVIHSDVGKLCYLKDIKFSNLGGYSVGWHDLGLYKEPKWFEYNDWGWNDDKYFNICSDIVNPEEALKLPKYKYSAILQYPQYDKLKYLRIYEKYPQAEYLVKLGLHKFATSKMLLHKLGKDKQFRKYVIEHQNELRSGRYYVETIMKAYKENKPLNLTQNILEFSKRHFRNGEFDILKPLFKDIGTLYEYLEKQKTSIYNYRDYVVACNALELDMTLDKNRIPHNLMRWHDIRINEMHSKQAEIDERKKKRFYDSFAQIANKYEILQRQLKESFITLIARSPLDLVNEGETLHHCVGRMGYDQKFIKEESLIFFVRTKEKPEIPLVTLEYSPSQHRILQCYGDNDSKPNEDILNYVNNIWLPYANRKIRKVVA